MYIQTITYTLHRTFCPVIFTQHNIFEKLLSHRTMKHYHIDTQREYQKNSNEFEGTREHVKMRDECHADKYFTWLATSGRSVT